MVTVTVRTGSGIWIALILVFGLGSAACQTAMPIEEARKVAASFAGAAFVPPPRTINDILAALDQPEPARRLAIRKRADEAPPNTTDPGTLYEFYFRRGLAARDIGRARQEIQDLTKALEYAPSDVVGIHPLLHHLAVAELLSGSVSRFFEYQRQAIDVVPSTDRGWLVGLNADLTLLHAGLGDLRAAEAAYAETAAVYRESQTWADQRPVWIAGYEAYFARAQGALMEATGKYAEAEALHRQAAAVLAADPTYRNDPAYRNDTRLETERGFIARALIRQGRLLEAEVEARKALLGALAKRGRNSTYTAMILQRLIWVLLEQGRYREAETVARVAMDIYAKADASPYSLFRAQARAFLATALAFQGRDQEFLAEYEAIRNDLHDEPRYREHVLGQLVVNYIDVLLRTGYLDRALEHLNVQLEKSGRLLGEAHWKTAEIRGFLARVYAGQGDAARALAEFRASVPVLLARSPGVDDEALSPLRKDQRLVGILGAYIGLLADIRGTALELEAGIDVAAEAFRVADVARGRSVQRALNASAARAGATSPSLAELIRLEQDATKQLNALHVTLGNLLTQPDDEQNSKEIGNLRARIDELRRALATLGARVATEFPAYSELVDPEPITLDEARTMLRPGEALVATLVTRERTFVWAVPHDGAVAFGAAPLGAKAIEAMVATLRRALEPGARTLGDIPDFDVALAHRLYRALLEPVRAGWQQARSVVVVADGPLGQLPFALLPTAPVALAPESQPLFSNYRQVPWLVRTHAVTVLPSAASLASLRRLPPGDPSRRAFVGFGDPYFSREQAALAARPDVGGEAREAFTLATRAVPVSFRSSPQVFDSARLAMLPRLPETAREIQAIAQVVNADPTRDVFLGARANEHAVKTLDLASYRVVAFATHGLRPGDLDGLTQPALALSAPDVAGVGGDGLLTMEEILSLRLNADWVVLSACNTAGGQGAGSEAISGLGRAFFYAGARALLVSNWPVETTSARSLVTELFRRQQQDQGLDHAQALQRTMNWLIDEAEFVDTRSGQTVFSYAHPIFWAPFTLIGAGADAARRGAVSPSPDSHVSGAKRGARDRALALLFD